MSKLLKLVLGAVAALVILVAGFTAFTVLRDSAQDQASLTALTPATSPQGASSRDSADGTWRVQTGEDVFVGYRIHELLRGADKEVTGRTRDVTGTMTVAGSTITAAGFSAELTGLTSDDPLRDRAIRTRGIETERFPQATFTLTAPLALPSAPVKGQQLSVTAKGDLTVHGVTRPVEVPLDAQWDGDQIRVATSGGGVRLQFQDHGFGPISVPIATTDDFGFLEVQLLFVPA